MTVTFEVRTDIAAPIDEVFDLARDVGAHVASQTYAHERAITGVTAGPIGPGETVTFAARHFGVPFRLTSRIVEFDRPQRFVDEQIQGPFKSIRHEHVFTEVEGGVTMVDRVCFTAPVGPVGGVVERVILGRYLHRLIADRAQFLKCEAESRAT